MLLDVSRLFPACYDLGYLCCRCGVLKLSTFLLDNSALHEIIKSEIDVVQFCNRILASKNRIIVSIDSITGG